MHGLDPGLGVGLNAALRETAAQHHRGPVWADLVESVDLVFYSVCTNAVHSHLIQVDFRYTSDLRLIISFKVVTWEIVCFYFDCIFEAEKLFVSRIWPPDTKGQIYLL